MSLRPYQLDAVSQTKDGFITGFRRVLLWLATGGGKTVVFCHIVKETVQRQRKAIVVVRGRKLVDQASKRLTREGVVHGVLMAGHWNYRPGAPVQVCSIDTLMARSWRPDADVIIIDEAHMAVSDGYKVFLAHPKYEKAYVVAVTATPYTNKPMNHLADFIVHPIEVEELFATGYLTRPRYFAPTSPPKELEDVRVDSKSGDYVTKQLAAVMDKSTIMGDIVSSWQKLAEGRPTICFAVNVEHSKHIAEAFNAAGIKAEHCDADTPEAEREEIAKRSERGETKVIVNVGILCTGVDYPWIGCIQMARPTQSFNLFIQCAGRGTRPVYADGFDLETDDGRLTAIARGPKPNFLILDHAGNVQKHGFINVEPIVDLTKKFERKNGVLMKRCEQCFAIVEQFPCNSPLGWEIGANGEEIETECGWSPPSDGRGGGPRDILQVDGELKEITGPSPLQRYECERFCEEQLDKAIKRKTSPWAAYFKTKEKFGDEATKLVFFRLCKRLGIEVRKGAANSGAVASGLVGGARADSSGNDDSSGSASGRETFQGDSGDVLQRQVELERRRK